MRKTSLKKLTAVETSYQAPEYVWDAHPDRWALLIAEGQCKDDAELVAVANLACAVKQIRQRAEFHLANADTALKEHNLSEIDATTRLADAWLATMALEEAQRQELRANLSFRKTLRLKGGEFQVTH